MSAASFDGAAGVFAVGRRPAEAWPEDLYWHKRMFRQSRFRWSSADAVSIVTAMSGGQVDFNGLRGLRTLLEMQGSVDAYALECRQLMVAAAQHAANELEAVHVVADALEIAPVHVAPTAWLAMSADDTRANVQRVLTGIPLTNPLTQAWELKQLWRLYVAARTVLEDTICDLIDEASGVDEHALVTAAGMSDAAALRERVQRARTERGGPGDLRRSPRQQR